MLVGASDALGWKDCRSGMSKYAIIVLAFVGEVNATAQYHYSKKGKQT